MTMQLVAIPIVIFEDYEERFGSLYHTITADSDLCRPAVNDGFLYVLNFIQ